MYICDYVSVSVIVYMRMGVWVCICENGCDWEYDICVSVCL